MNEPANIDNVIADADSEFPALYQLFGGYFHQDWRTEYATAADAVSSYVGDAPRDAVRAAVAELDRLLASGFDEAQLEHIIERGFGCEYVPEREGTTMAQWLASVAVTLRDRSGG